MGRQVLYVGMCCAAPHARKEMEMARFASLLKTVIVMVLVLVAACEPAAPEIAEEEVIKEVPAEVESVVTEEVPVEVEKEIVTFVVWAEGDFEQQTFQQLADAFKDTYGIEVDLVFLNE